MKFCEKCNIEVPHKDYTKHGEQALWKVEGQEELEIDQDHQQHQQTL